MRLSDSLSREGSSKAHVRDSSPAGRVHPSISRLDELEHEVRDVTWHGRRYVSLVVCDERLWERGTQTHTLERGRLCCEVVEMHEERRGPRASNATIAPSDLAAPSTKMHDRPGEGIQRMSGD